MTAGEGAPLLLALDAGLRDIGWAAFRGGALLETGGIPGPRRRAGNAADSVKWLLGCLDALADQWRPTAAAFRDPGGMPWSLPALDLLDEALRDWSRRQGLPLFGYTTQQIRQGVAGHPNISHEQLAFTIMAQLGLIGQRKSSREWEAIAVGTWHLRRWPLVLPRAG